MGLKSPGSKYDGKVTMSQDFKSLKSLKRTITSRLIKPKVLPVLKFKITKLVGNMPKIFLICLIINYFNPVLAGLDSEKDRLIRATTSVSSTKHVFLIESYSIMDIPLHIRDIHAAIDNLKYKLSNVRYSTDLENVQPEIVIGTKSVMENGRVSIKEEFVTYFRRVLSLPDGLALCEKLGLPILDLDNVPPRLDKWVLLHTEVRVENNEIICTSINTVKRGKACIDYLLAKTKSRQFVRTASELTQKLQKHNNKKLYLSASQNQFSLHLHNYGNVACKGSVDLNQKLQYQQLHSQYYFSLGTLYIILFETLEKYVGNMAEAVHNLATESYVLPKNIATTEQIVDDIIKFLPTFLTNSDSQRGRMITFEQYFDDIVEHVVDDHIAVFSEKPYLLNLKLRQLKIIHSAAEQFSAELNYRVSSFVLHFTDDTIREKVPKSVLYKRNQNPLSFMRMIKTMIPNADEQIMIELFNIIQNVKSSLLTALKQFIPKDVNIVYISHRENELKKKQLNSSASDYTVLKYNRFELGSDVNQKKQQVQDDQQIPIYQLLDEGLGNDRSPVLPQEIPLVITNNLMNQESSTSTVASTTSTERGPDFDRRMLELYGGPDPARQSRPMFPSAEPEELTRTKRSGFWTNIFGIATTDDLVDVYKGEISLRDKEELTEQQVAELSKTTNNLITNYKNINADIDHILKEEKILMETIKNVVEAETDTLKRLEILSSTLDRLIVLGAEYQSINLQAVLLIHSIEKCHLLIQNGLSGVVDVARLPLDVLNQQASSNLNIALSAVNVEFVYMRDGFFLRFRLPKLSDPFFIFSIQTIPVYRKGLWSKLDYENRIIVNSVSDVLDSSINIEQSCSVKGDNYICNPADMIIRHTVDSCTLQLTRLRWPNKRATFPLCSWTKIVVEPLDQYGLIVDNKLAISSGSDDWLEYICGDTNFNKRVAINEGFNTLNLQENCVYETSQLTIYNPPGLKVTAAFYDKDDDIDIVNALQNIEDLLDDVLDADSANVSNIEKLMSVYKQEIETSEVSYTQLKKDLKVSESLKENKLFVPTHLDLKAPFSRKNWLSGVFWGLIALLCLLLAGCFYQCCPCCCPAIAASLKLSCEGWSNAIRQLFYSCTKKFERVPSDEHNVEAGRPGGPYVGNASHPTSPPHEPVRMSDLIENENKINRPDLPSRYPNLENIYNEAKPDHEWIIKKGPLDELMLTSQIPNGLGGVIPIYWDAVNSECIDAYNAVLSYVKPPRTALVSAYQDMVKKQPPPNWVKNKEGIVHLKAAPHVVFSFETLNWVNTVTRKIISGLNKPVF